MIIFAIQVHYHRLIEEGCGEFASFCWVLIAHVLLIQQLMNLIVSLAFLRSVKNKKCFYNFL